MRIRVWALLISVVAVAVMFLFVFPTRTYLAQRSSLNRLSGQVSALAADNRSLGRQAALLDTDGEIERLARQDYGLVRPGQEAYAILPAPATGATGASGGSGPGAGGAAASAGGGTGATTAAPVGSATAKAGAVATAAAPPATPSVWHRVVDVLAFWR